MRARCVYFLRRADGVGPIKIGCSMFPERRAREMGYGGRPKLIVLAAVEGLFGDEGNLHRMFAQSRVEGEWFNPTPELIALIDQINETGEPPDFFFKYGRDLAA